MKADTSTTVNEALRKELAGLYDNFEGMTEMLQSNFDKFNQAL
jgi:hypothetical protein